MIMPFGKYEGRILEDVPRNYLEWLLMELEEQINKKQKLFDAIEERLNIREVE